MAEHNTLTGASLHEMKGASSAAANTVPVANGAGSTAFAKISVANLDSSAIFDPNQFTFAVKYTDIGTAGSIYVPFPITCTVNRIEGAVSIAPTTTDTVLTFRNNAGTSMGTMTIAFSGSAAGDVDSLSPASNNTFTAGQRMKIDSDGAAANAPDEILVFYCTRTG